MKGLIITVILFLLLILTIFLNAFFVNRTIQNMQNIINSLNSVPCEENKVLIDDFIKYWSKTSILLSLSVNYEDIEEITDITDSLKSANSTQNISQYKMYVELLLNSIEEIGRLEKISIKNIL